MTAMDTETSIEAIEALDFHDAIVCDLDRRGCEEAAAWWLVMPCCGVYWPTCDQHQVTFIRYTTTLSWFQGFRCAQCDEKVDPARMIWRPVKGEP